MDALEVRLKKVVSQALDISEGKVTPDLAAGSTEKWDSLGHLMLILAVENAFGIKFPTEAIPELRSLGLILEALKEAGIC